MSWLRRFGLHLAAAVGATGVLLVATTVGAMQTRQAVTARSTATALSQAGLAGGQGARPATVAVATPAAGGSSQSAPAAQPNPTPGAPLDTGGPGRRPAGAGPARQPPANGAPQAAGAPPPGPSGQAGPGQARSGPAAPALGPLPKQHSVTGAILEVSGSDLTIRTPAGLEGVIRVAPRAIVRLGGKPVPLDALQPGDRIVAVGQQVREDELRAVAVLARRPPAR